MLFFRRFPGVVYNHRFAASFLFLLLLSIVYLLFHWGLVCSNIEPWSHVKNLCNQYQSGLAVGDLCHPLCNEERISSLSCQTFHAGKEAVFSAIKDDNMRLVFKLARQVEQPTSVFWLDNGVQRYPTEEEFTRMIVDHVSSRFVYQVEHEYQLGTSLATRSQQQHLRDECLTPRDAGALEPTTGQRVLAGSLVRRPRRVPTHPRHMRPVLRTRVPGAGHPRTCRPLAHKRTVVSEEGSWAARVKIAVLILDLLQEIDNSVSEGFSLCDVKPSHFGLSSSSGKIKFLDLDVALPRAIVNSVTADGSNCRVNADCNLFDCRSRCNVDSHRCDSPQTNNNLQIVCEKVFLGWTVSGSVIMPGLLMAPQTPSSLASLLRQCADTDSDGVFPTPSEHLRERLTATLQEMDKALSLDNY